MPRVFLLAASATFRCVNAGDVLFPASKWWAHREEQDLSSHKNIERKNKKMVENSPHSTRVHLQMAFGTRGAQLRWWAYTKGVTSERARAVTRDRTLFSNERENVRTVKKKYDKKLCFIFIITITNGCPLSPHVRAWNCEPYVQKKS